MGKIILLFVIFLSNYSFGQNWTMLTIDSNVSIKLPSYSSLIDTSYNVTDLIKIRAVVALIDSGRFVVTKGLLGQETSPIKNEKTLLDFYQGVKEGLINTTQGELLTDSLIELSNLKVQKLSLTLNYEGEACILHYMGFLLNQHKYSLQILELESKRNKIGIGTPSLLILSGNLSFEKQLIQ